MSPPWMPCFFSSARKRAVGIAETMPADGDRQHLQPRAQIARHRFHRRDIAAVAGDEDKLAQAGARQAVAELGPGRDRGRCRQGQGAGVGQMLGGHADALHRQERHREIVRQEIAHARQIGLGNVGIDAERQMRAVLLDRGERQHRDPARGVAAGNVLPGHLHPVALRQHSVAHSQISSVSPIVACVVARSNRCRGLRLFAPH